MEEGGGSCSLPLPFQIIIITLRHYHPRLSLFTRANDEPWDDDGPLCHYRHWLHVCVCVCVSLEVSQEPDISLWSSSSSLLLARPMWASDAAPHEINEGELCHFRLMTTTLTTTATTTRGKETWRGLETANYDYLAWRWWRAEEPTHTRERGRKEGVTLAAPHAAPHILTHSYTSLHG